MDASESLSMILKLFYFVSAFPVLFNMYTDKDSNLISDLSGMLLQDYQPLRWKQICQGTLAIVTYFAK